MLEGRDSSATLNVAIHSIFLTLSFHSSQASDTFKKAAAMDNRKRIRKSEDMVSVVTGRVLAVVTHLARKGPTTRIRELCGAATQRAFSILTTAESVFSSVHQRRFSHG